MQKDQLPQTLFLTAMFGIAFIVYVTANYQTHAEANERALIARATAAELTQGNEKFDDSTILVKYKDDGKGSGDPGVSTARPNNEFVEIEVTETDQDRVAENADEKSKVAKKLAELLEDPNVEFAQPNYLYEIDAWTDAGTKTTPSDYGETNNWYFESSNLPEAWKHQDCPGGANCGGANTVTLAVIDTGLAFEDFDDTGGLTGANFTASTEYDELNLYTNPGETAGNNLDDDCNGYVDDVAGIDAYAVTQVDTNTCSGGVPQAVTADYYKAGHPVDNYGHGSFVTGIIGAEVDNGNTVGAAFNVEIMPIAANIHFSRYFNTASLVNAVRYAVDQGADVINMSLGSGGPDTLFNNELQIAHEQGIVLVAATGNDAYSSIDYPGRLDYVIAVGSVDSDGSRSGYSNYGTGIDVVGYVGSGPLSPGGAAYQQTLACYTSCDNSNTDSGFSNGYGIGTSYATPQVSALAAMIISENELLSTGQIKDVITDSAADLGAAGYDTQTGYGVIDFYNALVTMSPAGTLPVYRFWSDSGQSHFYTMSETERDYVIATYPDNVWDYEGIVMHGKPTASGTATAVHRFWSDQTQSHFYTISATEKTYVETTWPDVWTYEGIAYYAYQTEETDTTAIFRFWSDDLQAHFYTASQAERDYVIATYPDVWTYEGVAFYAY